MLVVGAGALGCGCLPYLVGAGVGQITVCDGDVVELSNLHRQVLFCELDIGRNKAEVAAERLRLLNSDVLISAVAQHCGFRERTVMLVESHDIVADCSDNVGTRYLLNDVCFLGGKTLVVAAALGTEGSLARWNYEDGPCFRCVSPTPSHHESRRKCTDHGVLGPIPGALGALQALDVLRCLADMGDNGSSVLRIFDGLSLRPFGLPQRRRNCALCGDNPSLISLADSERWARNQGLSVDSNYQMCHFGAFPVPPLAPLPRHNEATALDLKAALQSSRPCVILDVRDSIQFTICKLPGALSLPLRGILEQPVVTTTKVRDASSSHNPDLFVLCRRGIDSRFATQILIKLGFRNVRNVTGGLDAWRREADPTFPVY